MDLHPIPWMTKINSVDHFRNGWGPWAPGTQLISNEGINVSFSGGSHVIEDETWWSYELSDENNFDAENLFGSVGCTTGMVNKKRTNTTHFTGTFCNNTSFLNNHFTYPDYATSSCMRDAIGFGLITDCAGSYSNSGGGAQAYLEKCGFFYADPTTRKRVLLMPNVKVTGNINLNQRHPDDTQHKYFYSYRLSDSDVQRVKDEKLLLMSLGFQFVHDYKSARHTSRCNLSYFRVMCGNGTGLVDPYQTNRYIMAPWYMTQLKHIQNNEPVAYGY
tara:strand:+ start:3159 stop:3980 length:822 start_codon:yes stop_codon:yes gene_type:complete